MRSFFLLLVFASGLHANPLAGAWETFSTKSSANSWQLYAYSDGITTAAPWAGPAADENPYVFSYFLGGDGVQFFADNYTARGVFVGNYGAQKISGVDVSVSVDPLEIDFIDLAVYANGPRGYGFYYSLIYQTEDLGELPDWYELNFRFDENWFYFKNGKAIGFLPDRKFLGSIEEVGIRAFPVSRVGEWSFFGADDFILVPTVGAPELKTSVFGKSFLVKFTPNPGTAASIEKLTPRLEWKEVVGQSGLTGPQIYTTPIRPGSGIFRVGVKEKLTQVTSPRS